jgi:hypothetical protein
MFLAIIIIGKDLKRKKTYLLNVVLKKLKGILLLFKNISGILL